MTHIVKPGETLSKIARAHRLTLAELLDANPQHRLDPHRIRAGDLVNIPAAGRPPAAPITPQPEPGTAGTLGKLSEQFETGGRGPGTVSTGVGDPGGVSYGSYQMTSKPEGGTVARFVEHRDFTFRDTFAGLKPGGAAFSAAWKALAQTNRTEFQAAQHAFIKRTLFDPLVRRILREDALSVPVRSHALQDVIWSTAVQHGGGTGIPHRALASVGVLPDDPDFDRQFITAIYAERGRKNAAGELVHFRRSSAQVQRGVEARFREEERRALAMLVQEAQEVV